MKTKGIKKSLAIFADVDELLSSEMFELKSDAEKKCVDCNKSCKMCISGFVFTPSA